jgi:formiminotetrahydrofolate cyclodeaminase
VDEDVRDYSKVSSAYGLPKETEEEKMKRHAAIVEACRCALQTPLRVALEASQVSVIADRLSLIGNKNLLTDAGVSGLLCLAAAEAAGLNVEINLSQISDEPFKAEVRSRLKQALDVTRRLRQEVWQRVLKELHCDVTSSLV